MKKKKFFNSQRTRQMFALPFVVFLLMMVVFPLILLFVYAFFKDGKFNGTEFVTFWTDGFTLPVLGTSLWIAFVAAIICILIGYPIAYILALTKFKRSYIILMLFIMPMWINLLLRTYALKELSELFSTNLGYGTLIFWIVMDYLPFMILPIYTVLSNIDKKYMEASSDLGAPPLKVFLKTVLPLSVPGIISGFLIVFTPAVSTFFLSEYMGNPDIIMLGQLLNDVWTQGNISLASVIAIVLLVIIAISVLVTNWLSKMGNRRGGLW